MIMGGWKATQLNKFNALPPSQPQLRHVSLQPHQSYGCLHNQNFHFFFVVFLFIFVGYILVVVVVALLANCGWSVVLKRES